MSNLQELINRLCPNGVPYKPLGELGTFTRGNGLQKKDFTESGVGCIHYGQIYTYYSTFATETKSFVSDSLAKKLRKAQPGDLVIATTSENVDDVCKAVAWIGEQDIAISGDAFVFHHSLNPKYVSYFFQTEYFQTQKKPFVSGAKVMRVSGDNLAKILIPVPPVEVQEEIVRILDLYMAYSAELQAELQARKEQYEYYRNLLLTFSPAAEGAETECEQKIKDVTSTPPSSYKITWKSMGEIAENLDRLRKPITSSKRIKGCIPYYGASGIVDYVKDYIFDGEFLLISEDGANLLARSTPIAFSIEGKNWVNNHAHVLKFSHNITRKFVEFYFNTIDVSRYVSGGTQPKLNQENLNSIPIPIPPMEVQEKIVGILDRFETLVNDLSAGLPAEIAAVKEQYEYYRNKLLTFKKLTV